MIETVLCVDIGTTSLKAGLITSLGEVVSFSIKQFDNCEDRYIASQWVNCLKSVVEEIKKTCDFGQFSIKAIAISGNGPTLVAEDGLTFKWNEPIVWQLFERYGKEANEHLRKSLFLPRIVMLKHLYPEAFDNGMIHSGPEYLIYKLSGKSVTILPENRFITAYWTDENLKLCNISSSKMPPFVKTGDICGVLTSEMADVLGLQSAIPIIAGGPDFVVALIGTNTLVSGNICDRCGSSEGFNFCVPFYISAMGVRSLPSVIPDLWNVSVLIPDSGSLTEEKRFEYAKNAVSTLKELAEQYKIPFPDNIVVTGGQAKDKKLMSEKAKAIGIRLTACQCSDAELLGDCCAAWFGLKKYSSLQDAANHIVKKEVMYESL